ncbi:hypothetical protein [Sporolactobacillus spathodeae]|uniref:Uncharacterized protein n=1 Tax=Sporolactobacillus spathodeae TaxID=1465502 RepID=A0ABS2Q607_9BACL|nr:hypothetical protein [Sporolactobacillus spathodeae]MBM7657216.1 hypothetical protein [Sporolactobacillus spathodeae]
MGKEVDRKQIGDARTVQADEVLKRSVHNGEIALFSHGEIEKFIGMVKPSV